MTTTANIKLSTPSHGSNVDTWDVDPVNNNSAIVDLAFGGVTSKALTNVNVTLSATEAQSATLRFSGALSGNVAINVGAIIKSWFIDNLTTGAFVVTISGGSGQVVGVPQGETTQVYWDGTNVKFINLGRVGTYEDDCGSAVPTWITACTVPPYLLCDGSTFSAVTYPYLNTRLGTTTLPDFRGSMSAYLNGGTSRITTAGSGIDGDTRFAAGGAQNVVISAANVPQLAVAITDPGHTHVSSTGGAFITATSGSGSLAGTGGDDAGASILPHATGITATANTASANTALNKMPPTTISGIRMIRAA